MHGDKEKRIQTDPIIAASLDQYQVGDLFVIKTLPRRRGLCQPSVVLREATREEYLAALPRFGGDPNKSFLSHNPKANFYEVSTD
jgi:hypothetical protein